MSSSLSRRDFLRASAGVVAAVAITPALSTAAHAAASDAAYTWKNVQIGGGGFIPGIVFSETEKNLAYARTDIGGAYRWEQSSGSWIPLMDAVGFDHWDRTGVVSIATDPVDTDRVYAAVGTYTNSWDPDDGAVLRSTDRGDTWQATSLPFKLGGNMPGRGMGERLAVDPNNNSVLYLGTPSGHGLWRSTDSGVSWSQVTAFPNPGTYVDDPTDTTGYNSDIQGVVWVTFDPRTGSAGSTTQTIYVGVADPDNTVYRSTDGGTSWSRLDGQPTGHLAHKGVLDHVNGYLYLATSDTGGPYDGASGEVWRYATADGSWTDISPVTGSDDYFGFSGLSVDRQHPETVMVTGYSSWWPDTLIYRSTDSGATWTSAWSYTSYPNRANRYTLDISAVPWLTFGANPTPPEQTPKLGWMTEALAIDPFDSDRMWYGTGATLYGTTNLTDWDDSGVVITPNVRGLEETSVKDLISPPSGAPLVSALGDLGGFRHEDLTKIPDLMFTQPIFTTTDSLDFAATTPATMVRVGEVDSGAHVAFSTDGGANWFAGTDPSGVTGGGMVAAAADGSRFLWSPAGAGVSYAVGFGSSWTASTGLAAGAVIAADRVDAQRFYGFTGGTFYLSTDGGATFIASAAGGLPSSGTVQIKALPGVAGEVWLAGGSGGAYGLWHSADSGASFTRLSGIDEADNIGFGKAADGASHPALYTSAKIGGVRGIFRSTDGGGSWLRINDDAHQYGWTGGAITGDPRVFGRVYLGTNGRGIVYGDTAGGDDGGGGGDNGGGGGDNGGGSNATASVDYSVTNSWPGGFQASVTLTNTSGSSIENWKLGWSFAGDEKITSLWSASYAQSGSAVTVTAPSWAASIAVGGSATFGFTGSVTGTAAVPTAFTLNGVAL